MPATPGVYIFYGDQDVPLYIGKSVHLRQRIGAHFSGDYRYGKDMRLARLVRRVEWRETGGETGALLLEAQLVKAMQPVHNHLLRRNTRLYAWELPQQLPVPRLRSDRDTDFCRHRDLFGVFGSRGAAEARLRALAQEHDLCMATLSLEKTTRRGSPCFARQVHRCAGACVGAESPHEHRARLATALAPIALVPWPFESPVAWREQHGARAWWHVADEWCYLGCAATLEEAHALAAAPAHFDLDTYQILAPRMAQWTLEAVPLSVQRAFTLTAPEAPTEAPRPAHNAPEQTARRASAAADQHTLGLFAD